MRGVSTLISKNIANLEIQNPVGQTKLSNEYSYTAEENFDFLVAVRDKKIKMFSSAYSVLANTMEQFYKGIYVELLKAGANMPVMNEYDMKDHHFVKFIRAINMVLPVSASREGYEKICENAQRIYKGYTDSKYGSIYQYEDFAKDMRRYEVQRERLYKALDFELQRTVARSYDDEKTEDDDLEYYR